MDKINYACNSYIMKLLILLLLLISILLIPSVTSNNSYVKGIDVSHWQGNIDWKKVYEAGYRFAFVKATEGVSFKDPNFERNIEEARKVGIIVGAYHFAHPEKDSPVEEAKFFVSVAGKYIRSGYLRPALDLERGCNLGSKKLSEWVQKWIETVKVETGVEPIIYVNSYYTNNCLDKSVDKYGLWIAHWTYSPSVLPNTGIWSNWLFWQYSDNGSIPGIEGRVDLDLFNGSLKDLERECVIGNVTPQISELRQKYISLLESYERLKNELDFLKGLLYVFISLTAIFLGTTLYFLRKAIKR